MGYSTEFNGHFKVNKPVDDDTLNLLVGLASTRRVRRKVDPKYGIDGEFFVDGEEHSGWSLDLQRKDSTVVNYNQPPRTQPGLWCQWMIDKNDRQTIAWDFGEKFYEYVEWINYIANKVLAPRGYTLTGEVYWQGEDYEDRGVILVTKNKVSTKVGKTVYE